MTFDRFSEYSRFDGSETFPACYQRLTLDHQGRAHRYAYHSMTEAERQECLTWGSMPDALPEDCLAAADETGSLAGWAALVPRDGQIELRLALRPALTGQGRGRQYVRACAALAHERFGFDAPVFARLSAADLRTRHVLAHAGFREEGAVPSGGRMVLAP